MGSGSKLTLTSAYASTMSFYLCHTHSFGRSETDDTEVIVDCCIARAVLAMLLLMAACPVVTAAAAAAATAAARVALCS